MLSGMSLYIDLVLHASLHSRLVGRTPQQPDRRVFAGECVQGALELGLNVVGQAAALDGAGDHLVGDLFGGGRDEVVGLEAVTGEQVGERLLAEVALHGRSGGAPVRLGGLVAPGSLRHLDDGVSIAFTVTDGRASVPVRFAGIVPALFREGSGVVADGRFRPDGGFAADTILAKHDERYMPPEVAGVLHKSGSLKR